MNSKLNTAPSGNTLGVKHSALKQPKVVLITRNHRSAKWYLPG